MVSTLGVERAPVLLHTLAGFAMHRDPQLAMAAIEELKRSAKAGRVESALVERLVRMRPWLPADRHAALDEAIRALRAHALAPIEPERPAAANCFVMACDGSGAGGALASLKASDGWRFVAAMTKPAGVEEVLSLEGLRKAEADATVRGMRDSVLAAQTDVDGIARYLQLTLGENLASNTPPPFKLIAFVGEFRPGPHRAARHLPRRAHRGDAGGSAGDGEGRRGGRKSAPGGARRRAGEHWFEAGEPVERLLAPIRGAQGARQDAAHRLSAGAARLLGARLRAHRLRAAARPQGLWRARPQPGAGRARHRRGRALDGSRSCGRSPTSPCAPTRAGREARAASRLAARKSLPYMWRGRGFAAPPETQEGRMTLNATPAALSTPSTKALKSSSASSATA